MIKANFTENSWILDHLSPVKVIQFDHLLEGVIRIQDRFFVIFKPRQLGYLSCQNISCYDVIGVKLWDIQDPNRGPQPNARDQVAYDSIWVNAAGELVAHAGSHEYIIDITNGLIIKSEWTK